MYDLIALNGVSETQTQKQESIWSKLSYCRTGPVSSFTWHLLKHLQLIADSQRLWGRRLSGQVARLDSLLVRADSVVCSASCWYQLPQLAAATNRLGCFECGRLKVHPITFHVLVLLLLLFIIGK